MGVENFGDILHIIILALIIAWLFYHQWLITKLMDRFSSKEAEKPCNRKDIDFQ